MHQSHSHSCPSDTGIEDFLGGLPAVPTDPIVAHGCRFPSLPCHLATASGNSFCVMFSPLGLSRLQTLSLRVFSGGLVRKVMRLPASMHQSSGMRSSSGSQVQLHQTSSTCLACYRASIGLCLPET